MTEQLQQPLPRRIGPRPRTTPAAPHIQQEQNAPPQIQAALAERVFAMSGVEERPTIVSAEGARAIWLKDGLPAGPGDAFVGLREIGHFHPWDGSMHIALAPDLVDEAVQAGWAEIHPVAQAGRAPKNMVMLYGPRDETEAEVLFGLIAASVRRAGGDQSPTARPDQRPPPA